MAMSETSLYVLKRDGRREPVYFDKITARIASMLSIQPPLSAANVDATLVAQKVVQGVFPGVKTTELDALAAETAAYMSTTHPDYARLAARIAISNLQKQTSSSFVDTMRRLHRYVNPKTHKASPLVADDVMSVIEQNAERLEAAIDYDRDFAYDYFGFKTLERSYLLRIDDGIVERPQHMLMRVSVGIHKLDVASALETYELMSQHWFTHATPTLFNAGTPVPQMSSCFLLAMKDDSIEGIYDTLKQCALISKSAGGIGVSIHNIRATRSYIRGTNGTSNGLVPMLRVFNDTARYVDQGGGKRKGAFAIYLEPWHADIYDFLDLKKNTGKDERRARDLFFGLWVPDLFMERVDADADWSLFCPNEAPGLHECFGAAFVDLYTRYEMEGRARSTVKARALWSKIVEAQIETGTPYMLYKDAANGKSNQQNLGTIKSSNLCCEVTEYTAPDEVAVCNLASIALSQFVRDGAFDHDKLRLVTKVITYNLNRIIDGNHYPVEEARHSNMRHRPIGIGVQGLADAFIKMRMPFESEAARTLNREIFETIYYAALEASCELAERDRPYHSFMGSPASKGQLQFDLWNVKPESEREGSVRRWDWQALRVRIAEHGLRNSLLLAPMPTASTAQILGNNESIEPFTSNLYARRVLAGEFTVINRHLCDDLLRLGLWTPDVRREIIARGGSVQGLACIPADLQQLYKTVWEIKQKALIDMAAERGVYICQSQSLNIHMAAPTAQKISAMHFYGWRSGLKTGMYYLRTRPAADAIQFTVDQQALERSRAAAGQQQADSGGGGAAGAPPIDAGACTMQDGCVSCGS